MVRTLFIYFRINIIRIKKLYVIRVGFNRFLCSASSSRAHTFVNSFFSRRQSNVIRNNGVFLVIYIKQDRQCFVTFQNIERGLTL